jgi:hypothetical protein
MITRLGSLGWELSEDEDGGHSSAGRTAEGRELVGL